MKNNNIMRTKIKLLALCFFCFLFKAIGQNTNLDSLLDVQMKAKNKNTTQHTEATFKTSVLLMDTLLKLHRQVCLI